MTIDSQRARCGVSRTAALVVFVLGALAAGAADGPDGRPSPARSLSPAEVVATLGPGPLPPPAPVARPIESLAKTGDLDAAIDRCVQDNMAALRAPGAAVAVLLDGEMLYEHGYGRKFRSNGGPVDADTVFRIGSITKQMTAAAVMQQVELGRVELSAPVTRYIPELAVSGRWPASSITVWNALTHTTGFPDVIRSDVITGDGALSTWARLQGGAALYAPPGSFWNYSNPNFMIAGLVAERAAAVPYRRLLQESVWDPAGMTATTFDPERVLDGGNWSYGHYTNPDTGREQVLSPADNDQWAAGPAGFAFSTAGDLVRWALLLMDGGGPVLAPASAAAMQAPQQWIHYTPDLYYGYGIMVDRYHGLDIRQHGGNVAGYGAYLLWVPERRFAVALLTNVTPSLTQAAYCIVDQVLQPDPEEPPVLTTDPDTWHAYEGAYLLTEGDGTRSDGRVYLDSRHLMVTVEGSAVPGGSHTTELVQAYLDTFVFDGDGDGEFDTDITFCSRRGDPEVVWWARNRSAVGERKAIPLAVAGRRPPP